MASDILVVDDEADIRELVAGILTDALNGTGARVILKFPTTARLTAANAQNGVEEMI